MTAKNFIAVIFQTTRRAKIKGASYLVRLFDFRIPLFLPFRTIVFSPLKGSNDLWISELSDRLMALLSLQGIHYRDFRAKNAPQAQQYN